MEFTLKTGDLAFYDTMRSGLVPVKILSITKDGDELVAMLLVTGDRYAYKRGERINIRPRLTVVARKQVFVRGGQYRVRGRTEFTVDA